jgi:polar amino acid transport system substrate-binding protein
MKGGPSRLLLAALVAVLVAMLAAGCGASSDRAQRMTLAALNLSASQLPTTPPSPASQPCGDVTASLRPPSVLPAPGAMPAGSFMARIERRGYLIAGVNDGFLQFGYLNPFTGRIEGFEIDLVRELARSIFGNPDAVQFKALTVPQRIPFVQQDNVDIVVDAVTVTCERRQQVAFSTVYYDAHQRVLVPTTSTARGLQDLGGKRVCASAQSAPIGVIQRQPSHPVAVGAPQAIDCLVYLQEGRVEAISSDDSILLGLKAQDPYTKLVGPSLAAVPYGMAISKAHPEFVRFVNGVLARMRADGSWQAIYARWLGKFTTTVPAPPPAHYDG